MNKPRKGRRDNGAGTVVALAGGGFHAYARKTISGKLRRSPKFRAETKREAMTLLKAWMDTGGFVKLTEPRPGRDQTLGEYLDVWFNAAKADWSANTLALYTSTRNVHLQHAQMLDLPFSSITKSTIKEYFSGLSDSVSGATRHRIHKLLHRAFQAAVEDDEIALNPCKTSTRPKKPEEEVVPFSTEDKAHLIRYVRNMEFWESLVLLAFDSGMREHEILGLQVPDIDFVRSEVRVRYTVDTIGGKPVLKAGGKSSSSRRAIRLSTTTMLSLRRFLDRKRKRSGYVFSHDNGTAFTRSAFYGRWLNLLRDARLPKYHFHSARHSSATDLLKNGCYIVAVSKRLGHRRPSVTLNTYAAYLPEDQAPLAACFEVLAGSLWSDAERVEGSQNCSSGSSLSP